LRFLYLFAAISVFYWAALFWAAFFAAKGLFVFSFFLRYVSGVKPPLEVAPEEICRFRIRSGDLASMVSEVKPFRITWLRAVEFFAATGAALWVTAVP